MEITSDAIAIDTRFENYFTDANCGLHEDLPYHEYFKLPAINCSAIKFGFRTPYHMDEYLAGCLTEEKKEYNFGNYFHLLVFEEEKFWKRCFVMPPPPVPNNKGEFEWDMRLKPHKEAYRELVDDMNDKEIIPKKDFEKMERMRDAIAKNKQIYDYLVAIKGYTEQIIIWKNSDTRINLKGKFDKFVPNNFICDLKTTKDASKKGFLIDFERYLYKVQAAVYTDALIETGHGDLPFIFIAVEHSPPYFAKIYEVSVEKIMEGRQMYVKVLKEYIDYKRNGVNLSEIHVI